MPIGSSKPEAAAESARMLAPLQEGPDTTSLNPKPAEVPEEDGVAA